jgi:hypothetical protein
MAQRRLWSIEIEHTVSGFKFLAVSGAEDGIVARGV